MATKQKTQPAEKRWFTTEEAAHYLAVQPTTITDWAKKFPARLPKYRPFPESRTVRFRKDDLDALMRADGPSEARANTRPDDDQAAA